MTNPLFEGRILRAAVLEAAKSGGGWMKNLKKIPGVLWLVWNRCQRGKRAVM